MPICKRLFNMLIWIDENQGNLNAILILALNEI